MKAGVSLQDFAAEIERQQNSKADFIVDSRRLQLVSHVKADSIARAASPLLPDWTGSSLLLDGAGEDGGVGDFRVTDHTHGQIAERLGIPKTFYDRLRHGHTPKRGASKPAHLDVFDNLVNGLFHGQGEKRMVRTLDGKARAYLSNRYRPLDNFDLASCVLPIISEWAGNGDARIESCQVTDARLYIKVVLPKIQAEVKLNDVVQSGFVISNSEVGLGSLSVYPLVYRLVCLNGMIRESEGMRKYHVGRAADVGEGALDVFRNETLRQDDKAFWMKVEDVVRASANEAKFEAIVAEMRNAASSEKIADPVGAVERLANTFSFQEREQKSILAHLIEGGDLTAYGALNAITRASQDVADYDRATELEAAGGALLSLSASDWRAIAVPV